MQQGSQRTWWLWVGVAALALWGCQDSRAPAPTEDQALAPNEDPALARVCPEGAQPFGGPPPTHLRLSCRLPDGSLHGVQRRWDRQGRLREQSSMQAGLPHGTWTTWYTSGRRASQGDYLRGNKEGLWTAWRKDGTVRERTWYKQGSVTAMEHPDGLK
jgi:hypothetical protein